MNIIMRFILIFTLLMFGCSEQREIKQPKKVGESTERLVAILDTIWVTEQDPIRLRDSIGRALGFESTEFNKLDEICNKNHEINEKKIKKILEERGWPSEDEIGYQGSLTICNVLQHSDLETRLKYLPLMKDAVQKKILQPRLLARAEDRIATDRGEPQIYGGQIKYYPETKSFDVWPIIDPENVDKRRLEIGLDSMEVFLSSRRTPMEWNLKEQIRRTEEFIKNKQGEKK